MITKEQVQHIAKLARIKLRDDEVEKFQKDFASILSYVDMLNEVDVSGIEPMTHSGTEEQRGRQDIPQKETQERRSRLLAAFPKSRDGFLEVSSVILPWQSEKSTNNS